VKPYEFDYARPDTLDEVVRLLDEHGEEARVLAGGQSLMPSLNMRLSRPAILVDINRIADLSGIEVVDDHLRIGALTRHAELEASPLVAEHAPLLQMAIVHVAHPAIRNRGTIGGSIAFADPAAELPACALALDATIVLRGKNGIRRVPASAFFKDLYETARADDELVEAVEVPLQQKRSRAGFDELARRHGDFALVGLAAVVTLDGDTVSGMRLVYFGVENTPVLATAAQKAIGQPLNAATIGMLAAAVAEELDPNGDLQSSPAMKKHLASVLTGRVLGKMAA